MPLQLQAESPYEILTATFCFYTLLENCSVCSGDLSVVLQGCVHHTVVPGILCPETHLFFSEFQF